MMLGHDVEVALCNPDQKVSGVLRRQTPEGIWLYDGFAEQAAVRFFPQHRVVEIVDRGRRYL